MQRRIKAAIFGFLTLSTCVCFAKGAPVPTFGDYPATASFSGAPAKVILDDADKRAYRTRLKEAATLPADFAGDHVLALWGCGGNCLMGAAVSLKTGQVVSLPGSVCCWIYPEKNGVADTQYDKTEYQKNSRLLVLRGLINEGQEYGKHYYEFTGRAFKRIRFVPMKSPYN